MMIIFWYSLKNLELDTFPQVPKVPTPIEIPTTITMSIQQINSKIPNI
jgi:hypothetical protein